ncbi:Spermidine synthase [Planctomycetes bacterium Poly30]|uniref:Spermidine synthase n=1 Tax=Saltatorellus ferox TaxID=2528018 RepID=A0A518EZI7_9BACT|nr:Spermidine synthase [Planctomycetes bacterium Poly30]
MKPSNVLFFGSGAAALVYQTVWARLLSRLLGSGASGTALVLGVFMGGMAIGAWLGGGLARRTRHPVRLFVTIEVALAVWAAFSPHLLTMIEPVGGFGARAGVAALALLGPTLLMGMTFPLMGRLTIGQSSETAAATSEFYGSNTVGAAVGALLGPFLLMPALGLSGALYAAATLELLVAVGAKLVLKAADDDVAPGNEEEPQASARSIWLDPIAIAALLMGASALALEVVLTRVLVNVTGASIYAFSIVLTVFLIGIGLGSRWLEPIAPEEAKNRRSLRDAHARVFARAALWVPVATLAGLYLLRLRLGEGDLFSGLANRMPGGASLVTLWLGHATWAALALLGPAIFFGRALPSAIGAVAATRGPADRERVLGIVYSANTLGSLLGALGAGFVAIPLIGPRYALVAALVLPIAAALLAGARRLAQPVLYFLGGTAVFGFLSLYVSTDGTLRTLAHGPHATVSVFDSDESGEDVRALRVNGKVVATSGAVDLRLQRLLAAIPARLHGDVHTAIVIGMGTGMTAGTLLAEPTLTSLEVVEISAVIPEAGARPFAEWNGHLLDDPRTTVIHADGRHYLARSEKRYDLVTSDPIHPWTAGSSDLYCVEHFANMASHLAEGGIASQWLPLYQLSDEDVKTVIASWTAAFPSTSAWLTAYDLVLVGANGTLPGPDALVQTKLSPKLAAELAEAGIRSASGMAALFAADDAALRAYAGETPPMHDDRPVLEFRAPRSFLAGYSIGALRWAGRRELIADLPASSRARAAEFRDLLDTFLNELPGGWSQAAGKYGKALVRPE